MGRLIDADALKQIIDEKEGWVLELIDEQPTAYDVENVENEASKCLEPFCDKCDSIDCAECGVVKAINAIRKGGVE